MPKPSFDVVWSRIVSLAGQAFHTKSGLPFTYGVDGSILTTSRANQNLPRSEFEKAYLLAPLDGPGEISNLVRGPAYIWAILHDPRVTHAEWRGKSVLCPGQIH
jgi:hypothetical protein